MHNGGGKDPMREIGSTQSVKHRYSMGGRHTKHSKFLLKMHIFIFCIFAVVFQINDSPGPGSYDLTLKPKATSSIIKKDINPRATVTSRIPKKNVPGP